MSDSGETDMRGGGETSEGEGLALKDGDIKQRRSKVGALKN